MKIFLGVQREFISWQLGTKFLFFLQSKINAITETSNCPPTKKVPLDRHQFYWVLMQKTTVQEISQNKLQNAQCNNCHNMTRKKFAAKIKFLKKKICSLKYMFSKIVVGKRPQFESLTRTQNNDRHEPTVLLDPIASKNTLE